MALLGQFYFMMILICVSSKRNSLASFFKPCHRKDPKINECILERTRAILPRLIKNGLRQYRAPKLDPFYVPVEDIEDDFRMVLNNIKIVGFGNVKVKDSRFNFETLEMYNDFYFPVVNLTAHYIVTGTYRKHLFFGSAKTENNFESLRFEFKWKFGTKTPRNKLHYTVVDLKTLIGMKHASFNFFNLFAGDEDKGKEMNDFLNGDWLNFSKYFAKVLNNIIEGAGLTMVKNIMKKIPANKIFL